MTHHNGHKDRDRSALANRIDSDQTAVEGAVRAGCILCAILQQLLTNHQKYIQIVHFKHIIIASTVRYVLICSYSRMFAKQCK